MDTTDHERIFAQWLSDHRGIVVKVARSFTSSHVDTEDLVQEILLRVWQSVPSYRGDAKASTWIYRIALNRALTWNKVEKRQMPSRQLIEVADLAAVDPLDGRRKLAAVFERLRTLPEVDRSLMLMSLDGFSYAEMGEVCGMTATNVGARLTRARSRLMDDDAEETS